MMKTRTFLIAITACFLLAAFSACGSKGKEKTTVEFEDDAAADTAKDTDKEQPTYLSQDLATFDLYGQVLSVSFTQQGQKDVVVQFGPDGDAVAMMRSSDEDDVESAALMYNDKYQLEEIQWGDDPWVTMFTYEKGSMAPSGYISTNRMGNSATYTLTRDKNGRLTDITREEEVHFGSLGTEHPTFEFSDYDHHGNWQLYTEHQEGWTYTIRRKILYHNETIEPTADEDDEIADEDVIAFIKDMYVNARYQDDEFLLANCTRKMIRKLKEENEYDVEALAGWLFRTSSHDGKPGTEPAPDRVISIEEQSPGVWRYEFTDGGWRGINELRIVGIDGKPMIDDVTRIYDEAAESYSQNE